MCLNKSRERKTFKVISNCSKTAPALLGLLTCLTCSCIDPIEGEVQEDVGEPDPAEADGIHQGVHHRPGRPLAVVQPNLHDHQLVLPEIVNFTHLISFSVW